MTPGTCDSGTVDYNDDCAYGCLESSDHEPLRKLLEDVENLGCTVYTHCTATKDSPGLYVDGVGKITVPLTQKCHQQLQQLCCDQPHTTSASDKDVLKMWSLEPSLLHAITPGWDELIQKLAVTSSSKIGVCATDDVEASLQQVVVLDSGNCYSFSTDCDVDPEDFGKLIVMPMSQEASIAIGRAGQQEELYTMKTSEGHALGCAAFFSDRTYTLLPDKGGCYIALVYQLSHGSGSRPHIKNMPWLSVQFELLLMDADIPFSEQWLYIVDHRYNDFDLRDIKNLRQQHQQLASLLLAMEEENVVDVHLTSVTFTESCSGKRDAFGLSDMTLEDFDFKMGRWQTLRGTDAGRPEASNLDYKKDILVQGLEFLRNLEAAEERETVEQDYHYGHYSGSYYTSPKGFKKKVNIKKQTTRTAFVICPKSNRWSVLCRRGQKIAVEYMQKLLVEWQTCQVAAGQSDAQREKADVSVEVCASASTSDAAMASASFREDTQAAAATILTGSGMQSPTLAAPADAARDSEQQSDTAGRVEQPSAAVNQAAAQGRLADELYEIEEMCSAMWYTFGPGIARVAIGPYEKFVDLATKFNCSWVASQLLEHKYEDNVLDSQTAFKLFYLSKNGQLPAWSELYCLLHSLADRALSPTDKNPVQQISNLCDGMVYLGRHVQDACMWPTLAAFAVRAVHTLQVLASHGHLPGNKHKTDRLRSQAKQAFMLPAMDSTYDTLISSVAELLCVLKTTATHQQRVLASGFERLHGQLVDMYLAHPEVFNAADVLGPACISIVTDSKHSSTVMDSPSLIKLVLGSMSALQQVTQQRPCHTVKPQLSESCTCLHCQALQSFLQNRTETHMVFDGDEQQMLHLRDQVLHVNGVDGRLVTNVVRDTLAYRLKYTVDVRKALCEDKQTEYDKCLVAQQKIQSFVCQMVVTMFESSGLPPASLPAGSATGECIAKVEQIYSLWKCSRKRPRADSAVDV